METINMLDEMTAEFRDSPPGSDEVTSLFRELVSDPAMPGASFVFVAAWYNLSQTYVPPLCEILSSEKLAAWHEQSVELLGKLANPDSVEALTKSLDYHWEFDEWQNIPRKALHSLKAIGTNEALSVIERARYSKAPEIRQEATQILE